VHVVPSAWKVSAGHCVDVPEHASSTSHSPTAARQTVPLLPAGCVQSPEAHTSSVQMLPSPVHAVPFGSAASVGQLGDTPSHASVASHSLAALRHGVPLLLGTCAQEPLLQTSSEHGLPSVVQVEPSVLKPSAGQLVPLHVSATSHSPAAGRHTVLAGAAPCVHALPVQTSVVHTLPSDEQACPLFVTSAGHVRAPLQVSSTSHSDTAARQTVEAGFAEHVPGLVERAHESQAPPLHAVLQHRPSAQKPDVHSFVAAQVEPFAFFAVQTPPAQY